MKNILLYITAAVLLTACGTMKKSVNKHETNSTVKSDSSAQVQTKTTEQADTNVVIPGDTTKGVFDAEDTTVQVIETPDLIITFDSERDARGKIKPGKKSVKVVTKPKVIPVKINRTTTTNSNVQVKKSAEEKTITKQIEKQRTSFSLPWYIWLILLLALAFGIWRLLVKFKIL